MEISLLWIFLRRFLEDMLHHRKGKIPPKRRNLGDRDIWPHIWGVKGHSQNERTGRLCGLESNQVEWCRQLPSVSKGKKDNSSLICCLYCKILFWEVRGWFSWWIKNPFQISHLLIWTKINSKIKLYSMLYNWAITNNSIVITLKLLIISPSNCDITFLGIFQKCLCAWVCECVSMSYKLIKLNRKIIIKYNIKKQK